MRLRAKGFAVGDIDESYSERELFVGPNGSGKTSRLRAVELACTGSVASLGKTPGAAAVLAPEGALEISLEVGERSASMRVSSTTKKVVPVADCACRTLSLDLDGSAEKTRAFLGAHVRPSAEWTSERVEADLVKAGIPGAVVTRDILGSLAKLLMDQKETSKEARANRQRANGAAIAAQLSAAGVEVTSPGGVADLEFQRGEFLKRSGAIEGKIAVAGQSATNRRNVERALAAAKKRVEGLEAEIDPALGAPTDEDLANLEAAQAEADARVRTIGSENALCGTCSQPLPGIASKVRAAEQIARDAAKRVEDAKRARAESATWKVNHDRALGEARGAVILQQTTLKELGEPTDTAALTVELNDVAEKRAAVEQALGIARRREEAKAHAARLQDEADAAKQRLERSETLEDAIRAVRNAVLASAVGQISNSLARVCEILGGTPVIDLGDEEREPSLGINRGGVVVPLQALSAGERACIAAAIAGALLEQAAAPRERRVLLVEAEAVDDENMPALLRSLAQLEVGHVLVARHGDGTGLASPGWVVRDLTRAVTA